MRRVILALFAGCLILSASFIVQAQPEAAPEASPQPAPGLSIVNAMPQGEVKNLTQIVVRFSEPMHPLGAMEQKAESSPLRLSVPGGTLPPGNYRWLDPATLAYLFDVPVQGPVRIEAAVTAGATSLSGSGLATEKRWGVNTPDINITHRLRGNETLPPQGGSLFLISNHALNDDDVKAKTRLIMDGQSLPLELQAENAALGPGQVRTTWSYLLNLKSGLPPGKTLTLVMDAGIRPAQGSTPAREFRFTLKGYSALTVERWDADFADKERTLTRPESSLRLRFSNPVKTADFLAHLSVSPSPSPLPPPAGETEQDKKARSERISREHSLPYDWQPRTTYTVTVRAGLRDEYGGTLEKDVVYTAVTGDYYPLFHLPGGEIVEAKLGGLLPLLVRNVSPIDVRLRLFPWTDNPAAAFTDAEEIPRTNADASAPAPLVKQLFLAAEPNIFARHVVNLPQLLGRADGLIWLAATAPWPGRGEKAIEPVTANRWLQVTDLGLSTKTGRESGLVWISSLSGGNTLAGVKLSLYAEKKGLLWQGVTDDSGLATLPGSETFPPKEQVWLKAEKDGDVTVASLHKNALRISQQDYDGREEKDAPWSVHPLSQLPLYQPGQTVRFTLYARVHSAVPGAMQDGVQQKADDWRPLPAGTVLTYVIKDQQRTEVYSGQGTLNAYGSLTGSFTLSDEATLGDYFVEAKTPANTQQRRVKTFSVASFRSPDFKVDVAGPASRPLPLADEAPLSATVTAVYFTGATMPGAKTGLAVNTAEGSFSPPPLHGYAVGTSGHPRYGRAYPRPRREEKADILNGVLDAAGKALFIVPSPAVRPGEITTVNLEATVTDASGLTTQGVHAFTLHPSAAYVGIKAPYLATAGKECGLELKAATFDNKPLAGITVRLTAERRNHDGSYEPPVLEKSVMLGAAEGTRTAFTPAKGGHYRLRAEITDGKGRKNLSETFLYVVGPGLDWGPVGSSRTIELLRDQTEYAPGDVARVLIKNPLAIDDEKTLALVTTERAGVRTSRVLELTGPAPSIDVPLSADDAPHVYVSVLLIRGRTAPPPDGTQASGQDFGAPRVRLGTVRLNIKGENTRLTATVTTDAPTYRPGATVKAAVAVRDAAGKGRKVEITLLAVDNRVLRAAGERTLYDPSHGFGPVYSHGVITTDSRSRLLDLSTRHVAGLAYATASGGPPPPSAPAPKLQGGGEPPVTSLRENFQPDAFWLAQAETDDNGDFAASFTLPDSLTSYRIVAVAADKGKEFATGHANITAAKPLQLLSALPRFATQGDSLFARVLVRNLSPADADVTVTAQVEGMTLAGADSQKIRLAAAASGTVSFALRMPAIGEGRLRVRGSTVLDGKEEQDAAVFRLPVLPATPLTTVAAAGLLHADKTYTLPVRLPSRLDSRSRLDVVFAPSPAAGLTLTAQNLLDYPWHCLEQRLSRIWVRALRLRHGELLGLPADPNDAAIIKKTLATVPKFQKTDGGFALWQELDHSDLYLTAYVLLVNSRLAPLNPGLEADVTEKAVRFLAQRLRDPGTGPSPDVRAFALWVLSLYKTGASDASSLFPALLSEKGKNPLGLSAMLMVANALPGSPDKEKVIAGLLTDLEKTASVTSTQLHFAPQNPEWRYLSMGSTLRDNGMALWALASAVPDYPRLEALAYWLSRGLGEKKILSTQEAMFGLLGLTAYLEKLGGNGTVTLKALWNGKDSMSKSFERLIDPPQTWTLPVDKLPGGVDSSLVLAADKGSPYWTARLTYASPALAAKAENAGLTLTRAWSKPGPYRMGDTVDVTLTLTVPATRRHVLVFDPFPAGLEPLHASRADLQAAERRQQYPYPWQRAEQRDSGLLLYASEASPGTYAYTYTLRAAAPGVFVRAPSRAEEMYTPEVFSRTAGENVEVRE